MPVDKDVAKSLTAVDFRGRDVVIRGMEDSIFSCEVSGVAIMMSDVV